MADTAGPQLMTYLRARLDEEEVAAIATTRGPWIFHPGPHDGYPQSITSAAGVPTVVGTTYDGPVDGTGTRQPPTTAQHITYWNPARVLAEIEAKRAILDEIERIVPVCLDPMTGGGIIALALAQVYAGRDDFPLEWKANRG